MVTSGHGVVATIALGMGLIFWLTDHQSRTSRALGLFLFLLGGTIYANALVTEYWLATLPGWARGVGTLDALTFIVAAEWGIRVAATVNDAPTFSRRLVIMRIAQALSVLYAAMVATMPDARYGEFAQALATQRLPPPRFFLIFVAPVLTAGLLVSYSGLLLIRSRPDRAEQVRIFAVLAAMPFLGGALFVQTAAAPMVIAVGEVIFLYGALRYHMILGARGNFMSQFLSPQVAELVRTRGLRYAMARKRMDIAIVCCDIRRFTAHAQGHTPEQVMRLLRSFYAAVGAVAQEYGGTVKDLAGDGALILIGAPVEYEDRAQRAMKLARRLQARVRPTVKRYSSDLGLGVGVASGSVAVGIVGEGGRYEYMAVGPAVNLASRLCDKAADGEIHIDHDTLIASGEVMPAIRKKRYVKGIEAPVQTYVIKS